MSILFTLALVNASFLSIHETDTASSIIPGANTYSPTNYNHTNSEIVLSSIQGFTGSQAHHGFQKLPGNLSSETKRNGGAIDFYSLNSGSTGHLLIKAYLSHIYPSHNFW